jgi:hypothetical protein
MDRDATYDGAMIRVRGLAAIACCAGLAVGLAVIGGQLSGDLDPRRGSASVRQAITTEQPGGGLTNQAASSVPTVDEQSARMTAAQDLLSARMAAVKTERKSAWMATVDIPGSAFGRRQSVAFDNLITLPLGQFSYGTPHLAPVLGTARAQQVGPNAWVATVRGTYSLAGFDRAPRSFEATYTLVRRPDGWRIADDTDGATPWQIWDLPGLRVLRGRSSIVIGNAPRARMRDYSAVADSAVRRLSDVWGTDWNAHVVIVTPSTTGEYAALLLRTADRALDQVAAVTQGVIDPGQRAQGDRIVINPRAFTALQPHGRRVVITHELTHVAARSSTTRPVPIWLSEGLADYVAYSGLDLPRERVASELLTLVRQGKGPEALPTEVDFDPSRTTIAPSYSGSWLAVSRLVDLYGQARVIAFYRAIAGGPTVDRALRSEPAPSEAQAFTQSFGVTEAQFVDGWKRYLQTLAHARG